MLTLTPPLTVTQAQMVRALDIIDECLAAALKGRRAVMAGNLAFDELKKAVRSGDIDTVLVAMVDMQGRLIGKRFQARIFRRRRA